MNSSLPFSSKILLAWGKLTDKLLEPPAHSASENEKLLAQQENLLVLDNQTALFKPFSCTSKLTTEIIFQTK